MEPLAFTRRVIAWRWTPCVAPVTGSVLIALLTLAVVPDELGASSTGTGAPASASRDKRDNISDSATDDAESRGPPPGATEAHSRGPRKSGRQRMAAEATRGLLDTEQELPIAPGGPPPEPEPAPPLRPSPEVFTPPDPALAAPPPVEEPGTLPPLNAPPPLGPHAPPPNAGMP
jgi:hypothetical protein